MLLNYQNDSTSVRNCSFESPRTARPPDPPDPQKAEDHPGGSLDPGWCGSRLIGEIERGKTTAEIGKVFQLLAGLGLVISIAPRTTRDHRE